MKYSYALCAIALLVSFGCSQRDSTKSSTSPTLFTLIDPTQSGITFSNNVTDGEKFNILTYRNFYNGGGVAIGDINNDSLPDIYFTSNQQGNKLYLNKGGLVFEDITEHAGVRGTKPWCTGVTMADVNGDGLLDIYVCNSGDVEGANKENELYINNGNLTFTEKARDYNLNNEGYSTHAAFFDYDLDGDLDCYILNNSFKDPGKIELYKKMREIPSTGGNKLMRNDGGHFTDVTESAGIFSSEIGFGLGVAVSDLNGDHWPDIYVSNDFWERDYLYINQRNGKFSEELIDRINYCSVSSMGADIADLNNDGSPEIFTTDMLPADNSRLKTTMAFDPYHLEDLKYRANFHYQMVQNCLHLNDRTGHFQEVALLAGVSATDWSWGALIFDFENDGIKDIFVSNGIQKDIMSMDFRDFLADKQKRDEIVSKKGRFDYRDFIALIPSNPLHNYAFQPTGNWKYEDHSLQLGLGNPSFSNGSAYGDLDNDGDQDLVVNNVNSPAFVYRNEANTKGNHFLKVAFKGYGQNTLGLGAVVTLKLGDRTLVLENYNTRGFQSSIEPKLLFGLGANPKIEELTVVWPDQTVQVIAGVKADQTITLDHANAVKPKETVSPTRKTWFTDVTRGVMDASAVHHEDAYNDFNDEILLTRMLSTEGPRLVSGDVNGDKLPDLVLLGAAGDPDKLFIQSANGSFSRKGVAAFNADASAESTCGALLDMDRDGDLDLVIGSGGNEPGMPRTNFLARAYRNDGHGNFSRDQKFPPLIGNFSVVEPADFDMDGDADIFLGARSVPGNYGLPPKSYLLKNENGEWIDFASASLGNVGLVTDVAWADVDGDNDLDLMVVGDWMAVTLFRNEKGSLGAPSTVPGSKGWWNRIEATDLDNDGKVDFVLGNWGLNTKFKASAKHPVTMFVNDFDDNGKSEFIINWYPPADSISYPFAQKQEITSQLPGLRKRILTYAAYAPMRYDSLFPAAIRQRSLPYAAEFLETAVLWNEGGRWLLEALPVEAQVSPVFGIGTGDFDSDGIKDLWLGGNFYALKPQVGRHDASRGVVLKGNGKRMFSAIPNSESGISVHGEVRDAVIDPVRKRIIIARNNDGVVVYQGK